MRYTVPTPVDVLSPLNAAHKLVSCVFDIKLLNPHRIIYIGLVEHVPVRVAARSKA
jgi:hypothetical protein